MSRPPWPPVESVSSASTNTASTNSCLILHAGALGDCVLTLHLAMALRRAGHTITLAARSPIAAWAAKRGIIDESIPLDCLSPLLWSTDAPSIRRASDFEAEMERFDRIISFLGGPDDTAAKRLMEVFGSDRPIHIDPRPDERTLRNGTHITKQWCEAINRQGLGFQSEISILKSDVLGIENSAPGHVSTCPKLDITTTPHLIIHPGSGGLAKCCPIVAMEALMREMLVRGWNARWMIGPDEVERDGPEFRRRLERTAPVVFEESVGAAADVVARSDAFVGNDAGMTHVAALAGVKTVALFGPTDPRVWGPIGPRCALARFPTSIEPERDWVESLMRLIAGND